MALSDLAKLLSNPTDIEGVEPATLRDVSRANVIDMSDRLTNQTVVREPSAFNEESAGRFGSFIENPEVIRGLAAFGTAFAGGRPNEPGTILGQFATQQVNQGAERRVLSRILAGEDLSDMSQAELEALSPEALVRLEEIRSGRAEEGQGDRALDLRGRALDIDEDLRTQALDLERSGIDLRRWGLILDNRRINLDREEVQTRLELAAESQELQRQAQRQLTEYRSELNRIREAQAENQNVDTSAVDIRRERLIGTLSSMQESLTRQELLTKTLLENAVEGVAVDENDSRWWYQDKITEDQVLDRIMMENREFTPEEKAAGIPALVERYTQIQRDQQDYSTAINKLIEEQKDRVLSGDDTSTSVSEQTTGEEPGEEEQLEMAVYRPTDEDIQAAGDDTLSASTFEEFQKLLTPDNAGKIVSYNGELLLIGEDDD